MTSLYVEKSKEEGEGWREGRKKGREGGKEGRKGGREGGREGRKEEREGGREGERRYRCHPDDEARVLELHIPITDDEGGHPVLKRIEGREGGREGG